MQELEEWDQEPCRWVVLKGYSVRKKLVLGGMKGGSEQVKRELGEVEVGRGS